MSTKELFEQYEAAIHEASSWKVEYDAAVKKVEALRSKLISPTERLASTKVYPFDDWTNGSEDPKRRSPDYDRAPKILKLFEERGGFLSIKEAAKALKEDRALVSGSMTRLATEGKVRRLSRGRYALIPDDMRAKQAE